MSSTGTRSPLACHGGSLIEALPIKKKVRRWTYEKNLEMKDKIQHLEEEIQNHLGSLEFGLLSACENLRFSVLKAELKKVMDHELRSAKLQSRLTWASLGDANTKFFTRLLQLVRIIMPSGAFRMIGGF